MAEAAFPGSEVAPGGLDFHALRNEGIAMLQRLCGERWTDYNLHDPGVTTLEQLVYGLTDLAYRTDFDVADYLAGADGRIDYLRHALYQPEAMLGSEALTVEDYRRLIYDALADVAEIWVRPLDNGLWSIDVMSDSGQAHAVALEQRVRMVYSAHRTLGEDLAEVRLVTPRVFYLSGEIDTCGDCSPAEILARIYFDCGTYLSSGMTVQRLQQAAHGLAPEDLFNGPRMRHCQVSARTAAAAARTVTVSELIGEIQKIEGVSRVRSLGLLDADLRSVTKLVCDSGSGSYPVLPLPDDETTIELLRLQPQQGIEYGVSEQVLPSAPAWRASNRLLFEEAALELHKLRFERHAFRTEAAHAHSCYPLPAGRFRDLRAYYSIQNEFPALYGVGEYGLPHDATPQRRAQAQQLKGYLFAPEQLMANYLQNLQDIPSLFAADAGAAHTSYFTQYLGGREIPDIEQLYATPHVAAALRDALAHHDNHIDRKGRIYDYLLALYAESFPQTVLRRFNHYHRSDTERWLLEAKRRLLVSLAELSAGRGRAFDYMKQGGDGSNMAPLQRRVMILLGMDGGERRRALCPSWNGTPLQLVDEGLPGQGEKIQVDGGWRPVPALPDADLGQELIAELPAPADAFPEGLFRHGALLSNYRLADDAGQVTLYCEAGGRWMALRRFTRRLDAVRVAHASVAALAALNRQCEGMHVVEHVLLRPLSLRHAEANAGKMRRGFYGARISVVLPRWTLRCADGDFRNFVEETVRTHCPAHVHATFLWLQPDAMLAFEKLQDSWHHALRAFHQASGKAREVLAAPLYDSASAMVTFLRSHRADPP